MGAQRLFENRGRAISQRFLMEFPQHRYISSSRTHVYMYMYSRRCRLCTIYRGEESVLVDRRVE